MSEKEDVELNNKLLPNLNDYFSIMALCSILTILSFFALPWISGMFFFVPDSATGFELVRGLTEPQLQQFRTLMERVNERQTGPISTADERRLTTAFLNVVKSLSPALFPVEALFILDIIVRATRGKRKEKMYISRWIWLNNLIGAVICLYPAYFLYTDFSSYLKIGYWIATGGNIITIMSIIAILRRISVAKTASSGPAAP